MQTENSERFLEVSAVAVRLKVAPVTVYRMIKAGILPCKRVGVTKGFRVPESSVAEFERRREEEMDIFYGSF